MIILVCFDFIRVYAYYFVCERQRETKTLPRNIAPTILDLRSRRI